MNGLLPPLVSDEEDELEKRLSKLEKKVKTFRIIGAGTQGNFELGFVIAPEAEDSATDLPTTS